MSLPGKSGSVFLNSLRKIFKTVCLPIVFPVLLTAVIITQTGCSQEKLPVSGEGYYFDTVCRLTIYGMKKNSAASAGSLIESLFQECGRYESMLSATRKGSDIWQINHAGGEWVRCSADTFAVIEKGMEFSELSGGKFDIAVGALTALWDYHSADPHAPEPDAVSFAKEHCGIRNLELDPDTLSVRLKDPETRLDPGGIAKGYIADRLSDAMLENGVVSAVIDLGGNIVCVGEKPDGTAFRTGIELPFSDRSEIIGVVEDRNICVVTSGIYERYFMEGDTLYHHIIDPDTGYPARSGLISATVTGPLGSCCECDALSTICFLLGEKDALSLAESLEGYEVLLVREDGRTASSKGFSLTEAAGRKQDSE